MPSFLLSQPRFFLRQRRYLFVVWSLCTFGDSLWEMEGSYDDLDDECIHQILLAGGIVKRKNKSSYTREHQAKRRKQAESVLSCWRNEGVPVDSLSALQSQNSPVIDLYALKPQCSINIHNVMLFLIWWLFIIRVLRYMYFFSYRRKLLFVSLLKLSTCKSCSMKVINTIQDTYGIQNTLQVHRPSCQALNIKCITMSLTFKH